MRPSLTWTQFECALGELEGGTALAFASGMAAVAAVFGTTLRTGDVIAMASDSADFSVASDSKALTGHSDLILGVQVLDDAIRLLSFQLSASASLRQQRIEELARMNERALAWR